MTEPSATLPSGRALVSVEVTDYWCPSERRWSMCPGPCPDGQPHSAGVTRTEVAPLLTRDEGRLLATAEGRQQLDEQLRAEGWDS